MNIKKMRNIHLYLGCFFTPLLIFFIVSGCFQTFNLHESKKDGYQPQALVKIISEVHMHQRLTYSDEELKPSKGFRLLILLMAAGLLTTIILGLLLAFKYTNPLSVGFCLSLGIIIPFLLLWISK